MKYQKNIPLSSHTTFCVGGSARYFIQVATDDELHDAIDFSNAGKLPWMILGGGSNMLVSDTGYLGVVIQMRQKGIVFQSEGDNVRVIVEAGETWDDFVFETVSRGFYDCANLSNIPGTVGASPVQNIGAYGGEVSDSIEWVEVYDSNTKKVIRLLNKDCLFGYRDSVFRVKKNYIVVRVSFLLRDTYTPKILYVQLAEYLNKKNITQPTPQNVRDAVIAIRKNKLPELSVVGTAGSFFKNPIVAKEELLRLQAQYCDIVYYHISAKHVKISASWLIDHVGFWRGHRTGDAGVYEKQALVIVNYGKATAREIYDLALKIQNDIKRKTNITLDFEINKVGIW